MHIGEIGHTLSMIVRHRLAFLGVGNLLHDLMTLCRQMSSRCSSNPVRKANMEHGGDHIMHP